MNLQKYPNALEVIRQWEEGERGRGREREEVGKSREIMRARERERERRKVKESEGVTKGEMHEYNSSVKLQCI